MSPVDDYAFAGIGGELGGFLAEHVRIDTESIEDDVGASLYILENAKKYIDGCGGETQIAALMLDGTIHKMNAWDARAL